MVCTVESSTHEDLTGLASLALTMENGNATANMQALQYMCMNRCVCVSVC